MHAAISLTILVPFVLKPLLCRRKVSEVLCAQVATVFDIAGTMFLGFSNNKCGGIFSR